MSITEWSLLATTAVAVIGAILLGIRERRKPVIDAATAESIVVNSEAIKQEIKRQGDLSNARRDLRLLALEKWGFEDVRPWGRDVVTKFDTQNELVRELATALGRTVPEVRLAPFPEMPPPQAV